MTWAVGVEDARAGLRHDASGRTKILTRKRVKEDGTEVEAVLSFTPAFVVHAPQAFVAAQGSANREKTKTKAPREQTKETKPATVAVSRQSSSSSFSSASSSTSSSSSTSWSVTDAEKGTNGGALLVAGERKRSSAIAKKKADVKDAGKATDGDALLVAVERKRSSAVAKKKADAKETEKAQKEDALLVAGERKRSSAVAKKKVDAKEAALERGNANEEAPQNVVMDGAAAKMTDQPGTKDEGKKVSYWRKARSLVKAAVRLGRPKKQAGVRVSAAAKDAVPDTDAEERLSSSPSAPIEVIQGGEGDAGGKETLEGKKPAFRSVVRFNRAPTQASREQKKTAPGTTMAAAASVVPIPNNHDRDTSSSAGEAARRELAARADVIRASVEKSVVRFKRAAKQGAEGGNVNKSPEASSSTTVATASQGGPSSSTLGVGNETGREQQAEATRKTSRSVVRFRSPAKAESFPDQRKVRNEGSAAVVGAVQREAGAERSSSVAATEEMALEISEILGDNPTASALRSSSLGKSSRSRQSGFVPTALKSGTTFRGEPELLWDDLAPRSSETIECLDDLLRSQERKSEARYEDRQQAHAIASGRKHEREEHVVAALGGTVSLKAKELKAEADTPHAGRSTDASAGAALESNDTRAGTTPPITNANAHLIPSQSERSLTPSLPVSANADTPRVEFSPSPRTGSHSGRNTFCFGPPPAPDEAVKQSDAILPFWADGQSQPPGAKSQQTAESALRQIGVGGSRPPALKIGVSEDAYRRHLLDHDAGNSKTVLENVVVRRLKDGKVMSYTASVLSPRAASTNNSPKQKSAEPKVEAYAGNAFQPKVRKGFETHSEILPGTSESGVPDEPRTVVVVCRVDAVGGEDGATSRKVDGIGKNAVSPLTPHEQALKARGLSYCTMKGNPSSLFTHVEPNTWGNDNETKLVAGMTEEGATRPRRTRSPTGKQPHRQAELSTVRENSVVVSHVEPLPPELLRGLKPAWMNIDETRSNAAKFLPLPLPDGPLLWPVAPAGGNELFQREPWAPPRGNEKDTNYRESAPRLPVLR